MNELEYEDAPLSPHLIESMGANVKSWATALADLIDNSLDADSTNVSLEFSPTVFTVKDNGSGTDSPKSVIVPGTHTQHPMPSRWGASVGRYGIGGKESLIWIGKGTDSEVHVESTRNGVHRSLIVHWANYAKTGKVHRPTETQSKPGYGTRIRVMSRDENKIKVPRDRQLIVDSLSHIYGSALSSGLCITINWGSRDVVEIPAWGPPPIKGDPIDQIIAVGGRRARVWCGILRDDVQVTRWNHGFTYRYSYRAISEPSDDGSGEYAITRICGVIDLLDDGERPWGLEKNKTGIIDGEDDLYAAVASLCEPLLKQADDESHRLASRDYEDEIERRLNLGLGLPVKEKRDPGETHGTHPSKPSPEPSKRRPQKVQPGGTTRPRKASGIKFGFANFGAHPDGLVPIGSVTGKQILLNRNCAPVESAYQDQDMDTGFAMAAGLLVAHEIMGANPTGMLNIDLRDYEGFVRAFSNILIDTHAAIHGVDG